MRRAVIKEMSNGMSGNTIVERGGLNAIEFSMIPLIP